MTEIAENKTDTIKRRDFLKMAGATAAAAGMTAYVFSATTSPLLNIAVLLDQSNSAVMSEPVQLAVMRHERRGNEDCIGNYSE